MGKNNISANIPTLHIGGNKFAFSNQEKADALNRQFATYFVIYQKHSIEFGIGVWYNT